MQPGLWMNSRIAAYANLSTPEKRAIRDFALLWSFFEEQWLGKRGDVPRIKLEVSTRVAANALLPQFSAALEYFQHRYFAAGAPTQRFHGLRVSTADRQYVLDVLSGQTSDPHRVLSVLLIITYRLRNNFFHGEKAADGFQGQLDNFRHANRILMLTMEL